MSHLNRIDFLTFVVVAPAADVVDDDVLVFRRVFILNDIHPIKSLLKIRKRKNIHRERRKEKRPMNVKPILSLSVSFSLSLSLALVLLPIRDSIDEKWKCVAKGE